MHESMERLYKIALEKGIRGQSALARVLNESPQTVKNWESRGMSEGGALKAQGLFGIDANRLLGNQPLAQSMEPAASQHRVEDRPRNPWGWPFKTVNYDQYILLPEDERQLIEQTILMYVRRIQEKQNPPEEKTGTQ